MLKALSKLGIQGNFLKPRKGIDKEITANITLNVERLSVFPLNSGTRPGCPLSHYFHSTLLWRSYFRQVFLVPVTKPLCYFYIKMLLFLRKLQSWLCFSFSQMEVFSPLSLHLITIKLCLVKPQQNSLSIGHFLNEEKERKSKHK